MKIIPFPSTHDHRMWDLWMSMYHLPIVSVADELGLFSCINTDRLTLKQLADKLKISYRSTEILIAPLNGLKLLICKNKMISLSPSAQIYLLPDSSFYWGSILEGLRHRDEHKKILDAIKNGSDQLSYGNKTFTAMWKEGSITPEAANHFTKRMHATIFAPAVFAVETGLFQSTKKLLDVGGGSGCFSIAYVKKYPKCTATVFELPVVCDVAKKYICEYNLTSKIKTHPGDFFNKNTWPNGHDGVLLSQIVHDWPENYCKKILKNAYDTLPLGGKIYIHEMLLTENRTSPLTTACFDLLMFINHKSQQFTKSQLFQLLHAVGFKMLKAKKTFGYYSLIIGEK